MATGDLSDIVARIKAVLPSRWFPLPEADGTSNSPVLDALLTGLAYPWSWLFGLGQYLQLQTRISTATDVFLDIIATDYFGTRIKRRPGQSDSSFRSKILLELVRPRVTRAAVIQALTDLTGRTPVVFEPRWATDTGGIGFLGMTVGTGLAIGAADGSVAGAGGIGSIDLPFQFFVTAFRGGGGGIANVAGIGSIGGFNGMLGGIGVPGLLEVASLDMAPGQITDDEIYATIVSVSPVASIGWTKISN